MRPTSASRRSATGWHTVHVPRERTLGTIKPRRPPCPERLIAEWSADAAPEDAYPRPGPLSASASAPRSPRLPHTPSAKARRAVGACAPATCAPPPHTRHRPELVEGQAPHLSRASTLGTSPRAGRLSTGVEREEVRCKSRRFFHVIPAAARSAESQTRDPGPQFPLLSAALVPGYSPSANSGMTGCRLADRASP